MQEIMLTIPVKANTTVSPEKIAEVIQHLMAVGFAEAAATLTTGYGDVGIAELATNLSIGTPIVAKDSLAYPFVTNVAGLSIWDYDKDDGSPYEECKEPGDGYLDSHCCLMNLIEEARRIQEGQ